MFYNSFTFILCSHFDKYKKYKVSQSCKWDWCHAINFMQHTCLPLSSGGKYWPHKQHNWIASTFLISIIYRTLFPYEHEPSDLELTRDWLSLWGLMINVIYKSTWTVTWNWELKVCAKMNTWNSQEFWTVSQLALGDAFGVNQRCQPFLHLMLTPKALIDVSIIYLFILFIYLFIVMSLVIAMAFIFVWDVFKKNNIGMVHMSIKKKRCECVKSTSASSIPISRSFANPAPLSLLPVLSCHLSTVLSQ